MTGNRRAAQPLENAELDFMRTQGHQLVEAAGEHLDRFTGQAGNQIDVQMCLGVVAQPFEVAARHIVLLSARDALLHFGVEGLDADFELQSAWRKAHDPLAQPIRQVIGYQFEVDEHRVIGRLFQSRQEELQDLDRGIDFQIEGSVDELELPHAALVQAVKSVKKSIEWERPGGLVQRREAELTLERTATRSFHIDVALLHIFVGVLIVGALQSIQRRLFARNELVFRRLIFEELNA